MTNPRKATRNTIDATVDSQQIMPIEKGLIGACPVPEISRRGTFNKIK